VPVYLQMLLVFWGLAAAALAVWPRRPYLAAAAWGLTYPAGLVVMWSCPAIITVGLGTIFCVITVRALDAAASNRRLSRGAYLGYVLFVVLVPESEKPKAPPPRGQALVRIARGLILLGIALGLAGLGWFVQPWRIHPYLDDVWFTLEMAVVFTGLVDLSYAFACLFGVRAPSPHDPTFFLATSVRSFWTRWNTMFSGALRRAVFRPLGGRRRLVPAVLATFAVSGLVHCLPLLVKGVRWQHVALVMGSAFLFFMLHGGAVLLEGALPARVRRRAGRALFIAVWAVTIPLYPGMLSACGRRHRRLPGDMTILHVVPGLRQAVGIPERPLLCAGKPPEGRGESGRGTAVELADEPSRRKRFEARAGNAPRTARCAVEERQTEEEVWR
jgi:hypothetical protein